MNQFKSAVQLSESIKRGKVTVMEAAEQVFAAIEEKEKNYHCYISVREKQYVMEEAERLQKEIESGKYADSPIAGVPMAVKDNIYTLEECTTCASKMLEEFRAPYEATAVKKLKAAGALIIGKTNMDEFGMGSTTETSYFGATKNPYNAGRVPGGSSGGSAAAVAAGECVLAIGSDTGGSIRQPSSYCGIVGIKPTYGTVSRYGLIAYTSSLEQIGPMANNVEDCAALLSVLAGKDENDATTVARDTYDFSSGLGKSIAGMRIGVPKDFLVEGVQEEVKQTVRNAAEYLKRLGAEVEEFELGMTEYVVQTYCIITAAEASSNLAQFDGVHCGYQAKDYKEIEELSKKSRAEGLGREVRKRLLLGAFVLSEDNYEMYYNKALKAKRLILEGYEKAFEKYDAILGPVAPRTAPVLNEQNKNPLTGHLEDIYTVPVNLAGIPGISVPFGKDAAGMPIGVQLTAKHFEEEKLFQLAYALEQHC